MASFYCSLAQIMRGVIYMFLRTIGNWEFMIVSMGRFADWKTTSEKLAISFGRIYRIIE